MGGKTGIKNGKNIERSECSYASAQFCDASSGRWDGYFKHQNLLGHESIDTTLIYLQIATTFHTKTLFTARYPFFRIWEEMRGFKTIKTANSTSISTSIRSRRCFKQIRFKIGRFRIKFLAIKNFICIKKVQNIGFGRTYRCLRRMRKYQHQLQLLPKPSLPEMPRTEPRRLDTNTGNRTASCALIFHCSFTLPEVLNKTALHEPKMLYDILFESVWETLQTFGKKTKISKWE